MQTLWFALAAVMVAVYVLLDGFDFGAGALHLFVARGDRERRQVLDAIGPFWDGNEVWLLAVAGVLFLAFPKVLASGLSGFYLAIMMVLWVLIVRGTSIVFRSHLADPMWRQLWDVAFALASMVAPVLFGVVVANLVRGVPLAANGWFALPLFQSFSPRGELGILDWYTVLVGLFSFAALVHHGALFLAWKTDGQVRERSRTAARRAAAATLVLWITVTICTAWVSPEIFQALGARPAAWVATVVFAGGFVVSVVGRRRDNDLAAFVGSGAFILGLLAATATCIYPVMLLSATDPALSLTAFNASSGNYALKAALWWWPAGFVIAIGYAALIFRAHRGKVGAVDRTETN